MKAQSPIPEAPSFVLEILGLFQVFCVSIQILRYFLLGLQKNVIGNLIGIALNLWIILGFKMILNISIILIQEHGCIFSSVCVIFDFFHQCLTVF